MDKFDWILFLVFLQVLISLGILVLLVLFWLFLQGYAAAGTHASLFHWLALLPARLDTLVGCGW